MRKENKTKILLSMVIAICLLVISNIGYYKATPELDKAQAFSSAAENKETINKSGQTIGNKIQSISKKNEKLNGEPNEQQNEQLNVIPDKDPIRAQPSNDQLIVKVNLTQQKVFIQKNGETIRTITCSTGLPGKDTPLGSFKINNYYGLNFYNNKYNQGANYWVGFKKAEYLFHSVPVDKNGNIIEGEEDKLGTPASHGCIRMSMNDAYWFYETIPQGTEVVIYK